MNILNEGANYGWPIATYGINYSWLMVPKARSGIVEETDQLVWLWQNSPAVSGMIFYQNEHFSA
ncbi:PQQ-dependent sugar dehydrogenase [Sodalis-like endosymbiont of Proechinophthirus fluctus]|uniref:PQQ-dependent sugar dehydrogenase n=1 Tax=Sodalis-like endosymbiont of Proechinophthirus fluctus TaxID=1462730 RepID=UPI0016502572